MRKLFLDTGYLIALEAADDQHHKVALAHWEDLSKTLPPLLTTSYVFDEVVTFFNSRNRHAKAVEIGKLLLESPSIKLIHIDQGLFRGAWRYFVQYTDKSYSLTDCASFLVMKRLRIQTALTFDKHFAQAGFKQKPESNALA
ncbi:MAG: type II toxin-antitoxin system VapC family toxin [Desulfobacteria bacterium]